MNVMYPGINYMKDFRDQAINYLASFLPEGNAPPPPGMTNQMLTEPATYQGIGRNVMNFMIPQPEDTMFGLMKSNIKLINIDKIKPSQFGEDLFNDTSKGYYRGELGGLKGDVGQLKHYNQLPPILLDKDLNIIDGNMRWAASKMAGLKKIKAIIQE